jgi:prevent-host-death family protein
METEFGLYSVYEKEQVVKFSTQVKPISKLKAQATEVIRGLAERKAPVVITVNGEAKAVLQDVTSYEETQESLALLKILALSNKSIGKAQPAEVVFARLRRRLKS